MSKTNKFQVEKPITFYPGQRLFLTQEQAASRLPHSVKFIKAGEYEVIKPTMFKAGEVIGIEGELPKSDVAKLEDKKAAASPNSKRPAVKKNPATPKQEDEKKAETPNPKPPAGNKPTSTSKPTRNKK